MTLVPIEQAMMADPARDRELGGDWAGVARVRGVATALKMHFDVRGDALEGSADEIAVRPAALEDVRVRDGDFSGTLVAEPDTFALVARLAGDRLAGTARAGTSTGSLDLVRIVHPDVNALRPLEGLYRSGSRSYLIEVLNAEYGLTMIELPSGSFRNLFAVDSTTFVGGPSLLVARPEEWRLRFATAPGGGRRVEIRHAGRSWNAERVELRSEPVRFRDGDVTLAGTLIHPPGVARAPALVFLHGSGDAPRGAYFGLGYLLASQGIAVLKYDKRGSGESGGSLAGMTYEALADDAVAGAHFLQSRDDIDSTRIGFWGLSEGAWTAALAAARLPASFVVIASGGGLSPADGELLDSADLLRADGRFSEPDIARAIRFQRARDRYMRTGDGWTEYAALRDTATREAWYSYPTTDLLGPSKPDSPTWKAKAKYYFYDPAPALKEIRCPLLSLIGEFDTPSGIAADQRAIRAALEAGGNRDYEIETVPRANHDLFESAGGGVDELPRVLRIPPGLFPLVTDWLAKHAGAASPRSMR